MCQKSIVARWSRDEDVIRGSDLQTSNDGQKSGASLPTDGMYAPLGSNPPEIGKVEMFVLSFDVIDRNKRFVHLYLFFSFFLC